MELQSDLVFVGGGHAHALALRMLAMNPIAGLRITLVSPASHTPYSGMLPGLVAGHYSFEQTHIDLARLCQWAGIRFIESEVTSLDPVSKSLVLAGRPSISYDLLSIDIGSQPELDSVPGARAHSVSVKPVAGLWQRWRELEARLRQQSETTTHRVAVVGGGAGSVELVLAMAHSLAGRNIAFDLWCGADEILQGYNGGARSSVMKALSRHGVAVHLGSRVASVEDAALLMEDGSRQFYDDLFWCTGAAAAPWLAASGLACDRQGFLQVADTLQSVEDADVFATGDCSVQVNHPRPKAGVYAVRQGPVLANNLRARLLGAVLKEHHPQQKFLSLVSLGDRTAAADRGPFSASGAWVWRWKDRIDCEFMDRFENLPELAGMKIGDVLPGAADDSAQAHCGGCGAKVGANGLSAALAELAREFPAHCLQPGEADDAALLPMAGEGPVMQSLDVLRQIVADPWLMGRIAANHALSDLYACGVRPSSALAVVTLPFASGRLLQRELKQVLAGALHEFFHAGCLLAGGHSMQGPELSVGFAVSGQPMEPLQGVLSKTGARPGDKLVLTKPLGTGVLFAAHMQLRADGRQLRSAVEMMLQGNGAAAELAIAHHATACTDITGFGLAGHLLEMLPSGLSVNLASSSLAALPGAQQLLDAGLRSTGHEQNRTGAIDACDGQIPDIVFDPQTSGGLLIAVAPERADALCVALHQAGYAAAGVVGDVVTDKTARIAFSG